MLELFRGDVALRCASSEWQVSLVVETQDALLLLLYQPLEGDRNHFPGCLDDNYLNAK